MVLLDCSICTYGSVQFTHPKNLHNIVNYSITCFHSSHWFVAIVCYPEAFDHTEKKTRPSNIPVQSDDVSDSETEGSSNHGAIPIVISTQDQAVSNSA